MLSRDSLVSQRIPLSFEVQDLDGSVDGRVEGFCIGKCLVSEMMGFEIMPDDLDVVEFGRVFWQPLNGEPMRPCGKRCQRCLAGVDRAVVEHDYDGLDLYSGLGAIEQIKVLQQGDEVSAAFAAGCGNDQPAAQPVKRAHHGDFLRLSGRRHAKIGTTFCPGARQIGMRQRLALVGEQKNDIAGLSLGFAQLEPQTDAINLVRDLSSL
jgi:hypothetical protein